MKYESIPCILINFLFVIPSCSDFSASLTNKDKVCVHGFPPDVSKDMVELVYESKKLSEGGPVKTVDINTADGTVFVTFESEEGERKCLYCSL